MTNLQNDKHLIWLDLEMTGLDPNRQTIIEIATLITDSQLNLLEEGPVLAIRQDKDALDNMEAWSRDTHTRSGLMARVMASEVTMAEAEKKTLAFVSRYCMKQKSPLCGNSISHDRRFLERYMPELFAYLHYRNIDVSTIKELVQRWYPADLYAPKKRASHLAMNDIRESITELRFYREQFFIKP
jgi:oligoribonuclease